MTDQPSDDKNLNEFLQSTSHADDLANVGKLGDDGKNNDLNRRRSEAHVPTWLLIAIGVLIPPLGILFLLIYLAKKTTPDD